MIGAWLDPARIDATVLCAWLLAHTLGDFVFQGPRMLAWKRNGPWGQLAHAGVHFVLAAGLGLAVMWSERVLVVAFLVAMAHLAVDAAKLACEQRWPHRSATWFALDQAVHALALVALWVIGVHGHSSVGPQLETFARWFGDPERAVSAALENRPRYALANAAMLVLAALITNTTGAAAWIERLLQGRTERIDAANGEPAPIPGMGRRIGMLERVLLLPLILVQAYGAVGLVVAAKSIARHRQLEEAAFAEYYLLGTLASVLCAVASGLLVELLVGPFGPSA